LDEKELSSIKKAKDIFNNSDWKANLAFISVNYSFLSTYITCLEKQNMMLFKSISVVITVKRKILRKNYKIHKEQKERLFTKNWKMYCQKIKDLKLLKTFSIF
jgi:hypothetical protein